MNEDQHDRRPVASGNCESPQANGIAAACSRRKQIPAPSASTFLVFILILVGLLVAGYFLGYLPRQRREHVLATESKRRGFEPADCERRTRQALGPPDQPATARQYSGNHRSPRVGAFQRLCPQTLRRYRRPRNGR